MGGTVLAIGELLGDVLQEILNLLDLLSDLHHTDVADILF